MGDRKSHVVDYLRVLVSGTSRSELEVRAQTQEFMPFMVPFAGMSPSEIKSLLKKIVEDKRAGHKLLFSNNLVVESFVREYVAEGLLSPENVEIRVVLSCGDGRSEWTCRTAKLGQEGEYVKGLEHVAKLFEPYESSLLALFAAQNHKVANKSVSQWDSEFDSANERLKKRKGQ